jgi:hypothetical protein
MLQDAMDVVPRDVFDGLGMVVEGGDERKDGRARLCDRGHVADVDEVERRLADAEDEAAALLQADVGSALDEVARNAVGDARKRSHGARKDEHRVQWVRTAGDGGADVFVREERDLFRRMAEEFFYQRVASAEACFFREDPQSTGGDDQVDPADAFVGIERMEHLDSKHRSAGPCNGKNESELRWGGGRHQP